MPRECAACKQQPASVLARLHRDEKSIVAPLCQQCLIRLSQKTRVEILEAIPVQESAEKKKVKQKVAHSRKSSKKPLLITLVVLLLLASIVCSAVFIVPLIKKAIQKVDSEISDTPMTPEQIYEYASVATAEITAIGDNFISTGTGFFCDTDEYLITNYHVIAGATDAYITIHDGGRYDITGLYGYDEDQDIALLTTTYKPQTILKSCAESTQTGESVYVIGSSEGLTSSFSSGIISSSQRDLDGQVYIQITAPISHGNSGGPVLNDKGEVIGISTAYIEEGQNLNFAIPINQLSAIKVNKEESILLSQQEAQIVSQTPLQSFEDAFDQLYDFIVQNGSKSFVTVDKDSIPQYKYLHERRDYSQYLYISVFGGYDLITFEFETPLISGQTIDATTRFNVRLSISKQLYPKCLIDGNMIDEKNEEYSFEELSFTLSDLSPDSYPSNFEVYNVSKDYWVDNELYKNMIFSYPFGSNVGRLLSVFDNFLHNEGFNIDITDFGFSK